MFATIVSKQLSVQRKINTLKSSDRIITLKHWDVVIDSCFDYKKNNCSEADLVINNAMINDREKSSHWLKKVSDIYSGDKAKKPIFYVVNLNHKLSFRALSWLKSNKQSSLVMPELVGTNVQMISPVTTAFMVSSMSDFKVTLPESLQKTSEIKMKLLVGAKQKWFGLNNLDPALVHWQFVDQYANIDQLTQVVYFLQRASLVIFPLIISALSLILDHVKVILGLSLLSVIYSSRVLAATLYENSGYELQSFLGFIILILYALSPIFLVRLAMIMFSIRIKLSYQIIAAFLLIFLNLAFNFLDNSKLYLEKAHFLNDMGGTLAALFVCFYCLIDKYRYKLSNGSMLSVENANQSDAKDKTDYNANIDKKDKYKNLILSTFIFAAAFGAYTWDYISYLYDFDNVVQSWIHQLFIPSLFVLALFNIGSIVNTIKRVSKIVQEKTKIDRDIEIGKELQSGILPDKKYTSDLYKWHAFYYPASHLAGDWFDLRQVTTANHKNLFLGCIVDVTGHGISSAMMTSNIASHWGLWCNSVSDLHLQDSQDDYHSFIESVPYQIHRGLIGLRYNLGCSMAVLMYESTTRLLVYLTAGHPGIILAKGNQFEYLSSVGTRPGITNGVCKWTAKSKVLDNEDYIVSMFTDGLVKEHLAVPTWLKHIRRNSKKANKSPTYYLTSQLRENRKLFLKNPEKEDDLTLLVINIQKTLYSKKPSFDLSLAS